MSDETLINRLYRHVAKYNIVDRLGKEWDGLPSIVIPYLPPVEDEPKDVAFDIANLMRLPDTIYYPGDMYKYEYWVGKLGELCKSPDDLQVDRHAVASVRHACDVFARAFVEWLVNDAVTQTEVSLKKIMTAVQKRDSSSIRRMIQKHPIISHTEYHHISIPDFMNSHTCGCTLEEASQIEDKEYRQWHMHVCEYESNEALYELLDPNLLKIREESVSKNADGLSGYARNNKLLLEILYLVCWRFFIFHAPNEDANRDECVPESSFSSFIAPSAENYVETVVGKVRYMQLSAELRATYKNLIRKIRPFLKDQDAARRARSLYKDMYEYIDLDCIELAPRDAYELIYVTKVD